MSAVLVTGGAGYVGSHAAKALRAAGHMPIAFDNLSAGREHAVRWGPLIQGDIRDAGALRLAIRRHQPACVMHFAALTDVGDAERAPAGYYDVNVAGTLTLLKVMTEERVGRIIFSSSCAVHGEPDALPVGEDHPRRPVNVYGRTKLMAEQVIEDMARAHGLSFVTLRYFNAAGADPDGELGEDPATTRLIPNVLKAAAGLGPPVQVFGTDYPTRDGTCIRDFVHVSDIADAHVLAARRLEAGGGSLYLGVGSGDGHSVFEVIDAASRVSGRPVAHVIAPRRNGDAVSLVADPTRCRSELGWAPQRSGLDAILSTAWAFQERRPALVNARQ